jgi:hypothetical protein
MDAPSFTNLLGVAAIAFAVPFLLGLTPAINGRSSNANSRLTLC